MLILAVDTATSVSSVALATADRLLGEVKTDLPRTHSQRLLPLVDSLLAETGTAPGEIDLLAVARGPGSFTGLRIGIATVKGLALALDRPVVGISTLEALAHGFGAGLVCPVLNARLGQVYGALFRVGETPRPRCLLPEQAIGVPDLLARLGEYSEPIWFCGDGADLVFPLARQVLTQPRPAPLHLAGSRAGALADLARHSESSPADDLAPLYLRDPQAEVLRRQRRNSE